MSQDTNTRIKEWAQWYHWHKSSVGRSEDLRKMEEFYTRAIDGLLEITACLAKDVQELERGKKGDFNGLYLPRAVRLNEPVRGRQ